MPQGNVEIILLKQLASYIAMPMFIVGPDGELRFFNEPAEPILGRRFEETGEMSRDEWSGLLAVSDDDGVPIKQEERPMIAALERKEPTHRRFWLLGLDGRRRQIRGTAIPLIGVEGNLLGALGLFWELRDAEESPPRPVAPQPHSRQHAVETILTRRLATYLALPIFLTDRDGRLLFFNQAAEPILGRPFPEVVATPRDELYATFEPRDPDGRAIDSKHHPIWLARIHRELVHRRFSIRGFDGVLREIEATAIPLIGQCGRMLGVVGIFWEIRRA